MPALTAWAQFAGCAIAIGYAGSRLTRLADAIAEKAGLSRSWIGLVLLDLLYRPDSIYKRASHEHVLSAAFGGVLLSVLGASLLLERQRILPAIGHIGTYTPLLVLLYLVAMRSVFLHGLRNAQLPDEPAAQLYADITTRQAVARFEGFALVVAAAGTWLPFIGACIADDMGWSRTFVGTRFAAGATSLPEVVVTGADGCMHRAWSALCFSPCTG